MAAGLLRLREDDISLLPPWPLPYLNSLLRGQAGPAPWARWVDWSSSLLLASLLLSLAGTLLPHLPQCTDVLQFAAVYPQVREAVLLDLAYGRQLNLLMVRIVPPC